MRQKIQRHLDDLDPTTRDAARRAARRAGMPLADWVNAVVAEQAGLEPDDATEDEGASPVAQRIGEITERLEGFGAGRRGAQRQRDDGLVEETARKTVEALDSVARWMEDAEARWMTSNRRIDEVQERSVITFTRAFDAMAKRLDAIESKVSEGLVDPPALKPIWGALQKLERNVAEMASRGDDVARLEKTLSGFETRLGSIAEQIAASARSRPRRETMMTALDDIRRRQAELDGPSQPQRPRDAVGERSADETGQLVREMSRLAESLTQLAPRSAVEALHDALNRIGSRLEDGSLQDAPRATKLAVERVHAEVQAIASTLRTGSEAMADELRAAAQALRTLDSVDLASLTRDVADIRSAVARTADKDQIATLAEQMAALSLRVDRLAAREAAPSDFSDLRRVVDDIRLGLDRSTQGDAAPAAILDIIERVSERIDGLGRRIDELAARPAPAAEADSKLHGLLSSLVTKIDALSRETPGVQTILPATSPSALDALEAKLDTIAQRLDRPQTVDMGGLQQALSDLTGRIDRVQSGEKQDDRALEALERSIETLAIRIDSVAAKPGASADETRRIVDDALKTVQKDSHDRIDRTLDAIGGTLEKLLTRLSLIEREAPAPKAAAPDAGVSDMPLEPGSGRPRVTPPRAGIPASQPETVPASAAADAFDAPVTPPARSGNVRTTAAGATTTAPAAGPSAAPQLADPADMKASFIAAARRAAQAAAEEAASGANASHGGSLNSRLRSIGSMRRASAAASPAIGVTAADRAEPAASKAAEAGSGLAGRLSGLRATLAARRKPLLYALAALVLALGTAQIVRNLTAPSEPSTQTSLAPTNPAAAPPAAPAVDAAKPADPETTQSTRPAAAPRASDAPPGPSSLVAPPATAPTVLSAFDAVAPIVPAPAPLAGSTQTAAPIVVKDLKAQDIPAGAGPSGLRQAALRGDPVAVYEVASRLIDGRDVARNPQAALKLFERLAAEGHAPAQFRLGNIFEKGHAGPRDPLLARIWYERAAERGNVRAMHNLAVIHADGGGQQPDYVGAVRWFERAAGFGVSDSQYNLAILKARGLGTERDLPGSFRWFAAAAAQGDQDAARKRDEVAARLSPTELAAATDAMEKFKPLPTDRLANEVVLPEKGFEDSAASKAQKRARS